jgi:hypothetical protein
MNYKVFVKDEKISKKVQKHAFKLGYVWVFPEAPKNMPIKLNEPFLLFRESMPPFSKVLLCADSFNTFNSYIDHKELTVKEFLVL